MKKLLEKYPALAPMVRPFVEVPTESSPSQPPVKPPVVDASSNNITTSSSMESKTFSENVVITPNPVAASCGVNLDKNMFYKYSSGANQRHGEFYENTLKDSIVSEVYINPTDSTSTEQYRNLLRSKNTVENLPASAVKPDCIDNDVIFQRMCGTDAALHVIKKGGEVTDVMLAYGYTIGFAGHNLDKMQSAVPHVPALRGKHNFHKNLSEDILAALSPKEQEHVASMTLKEPLQITEYAALGKINPSQEVKLVHAKGENPDPRSLPGYLNITPNKKPDFVSYLPQPVGVTTAVGFDFKYVLGRMPNKNIVKGCTINLEKHIFESHDLLSRSLQEHLESGKLDQKNQKLAYELKKHLENNIATFKQNKDLDGAIYSYNSLRNEFGSFLIENKIGMTLLAHINKRDFVINTDTYNAFVEKLLDNYTNPHSNLQKTLEAHAAANFGKIPNENHAITALAKSIFPDK